MQKLSVTRLSHIWVVPEEIHTTPTVGNFLREGGEGSQRLWKSRRKGAGWTWKSPLQGSFWPIVHVIRMLIKFSDTSVLSDHENSGNFLFAYFLPDINDNLSSFAGSFIAENTNTVYQRTSHRNIVATKSLKCLTLFYLYPDPVRHPCAISR